MEHVPLTFDDAYRSYVSDMQAAYDANVGFVPIDRVILRQPLAQMLLSLVSPSVKLSIEDKCALVLYHYQKHGIDIAANEHALIDWLVNAGNEHRQVIETLDSRPQTLRIYGPGARLILEPPPA